MVASPAPTAAPVVEAIQSSALERALPMIVDSFDLRTLAPNNIDAQSTISLRLNYAPDTSTITVELATANSKGDLVGFLTQLDPSKKLLSFGGKGIVLSDALCEELLKCRQASVSLERLASGTSIEAMPALTTTERRSEVVGRNTQDLEKIITRYARYVGLDTSNATFSVEDTRNPLHGTVLGVKLVFPDNAVLRMAASDVAGVRALQLFKPNSEVLNTFTCERVFLPDTEAVTDKGLDLSGASLGVRPPLESAVKRGFATNAPREALTPIELAADVADILHHLSRMVGSTDPSKLNMLHTKLHGNKAPDESLEKIRRDAVGADILSTIQVLGPILVFRLREITEFAAKLDSSILLDLVRSDQRDSFQQSLDSDGARYKVVGILRYGFYRFVGEHILEAATGSSLAQLVLNAYGDQIGEVDTPVTYRDDQYFERHRLALDILTGVLKWRRSHE